MQKPWAWVSLAATALLLAALVVGETSALGLLFTAALPAGITIALFAPERPLARAALPVGALPELFLALDAYRFWTDTGASLFALTSVYLRVFATLALFLAFVAWAVRPSNAFRQTARALAVLRLLIVLLPLFLDDALAPSALGAAGPAAFLIGFLPLVPVACLARALPLVLRLSPTRL